MGIRAGRRRVTSAMTRRLLPNTALCLLFVSAFRFESLPSLSHAFARIVISVARLDPGRPLRDAKFLPRDAEISPGNVQPLLGVGAEAVGFRTGAVAESAHALLPVAQIAPRVFGILLALRAGLFGCRRARRLRRRGSAKKASNDGSHSRTPPVMPSILAARFTCGGR